jgi:hypothetical protein
MRSAAGARHAPGRAMAFAARAAGQGASLLSSQPCAPIAEIVLRHGPVEGNALARPSSSDRPEGGRHAIPTWNPQYGRPASGWRRKSRSRRFWDRRSASGMSLRSVHERAACRGPGGLGRRLDPLRLGIAQHLLGHWGFFLQCIGHDPASGPFVGSRFLSLFPWDEFGTA